MYVSKISSWDAIEKRNVTHYRRLTCMHDEANSAVKDGWRLCPVKQIHTIIIKVCFVYFLLENCWKEIQLILLLKFDWCIFYYAFITNYHFISQFNSRFNSKRLHSCKLIWFLSKLIYSVTKHFWRKRRSPWLALASGAKQVPWPEPASHWSQPPSGAKGASLTATFLFVK